MEERNVIKNDLDLTILVYHHINNLPNPHPTKRHQNLTVSHALLRSFRKCGPCADSKTFKIVSTIVSR